jgi:hypothetical protein
MFAQVIPNPKDVITKGMGSLIDLQMDILATKYDFMLGQWSQGRKLDGAETYGVPTFAFMQAVESMKQAKELGQKEEQEEKAEEERRKNIILLIISIVLLIVPVVGEELALAAGLTNFARTLAITGEVGNAAVAFYDSGSDPGAAFLNVMGLVAGVGSVAKISRDGNGFREVANIRRGMSSDTVSSLGKIFKENDNKLAAITRICKMR